MVEIICAAPGAVDLIWPHIKDGIAESCAATGSEVRPGHLWQDCRAARAFLLVAYEGEQILGACILQFQDGGRVLRGLAFYDQRAEEWFPQMQDLSKKIGRDGGAERFLDEARPGMKKLYPEARAVAIVYEVPL